MDFRCTTPFGGDGKWISRNTDATPGSCNINHAEHSNGLELKSKETNRSNVKQSNPQDAHCFIGDNMPFMPVGRYRFGYEDEMD